MAMVQSKMWIVTMLMWFALTEGKGRRRILSFRLQLLSKR